MLSKYVLKKVLKQEPEGNTGQSEVLARAFLSTMNFSVNY